MAEDTIEQKVHDSESSEMISGATPNPGLTVVFSLCAKAEINKEVMTEGRAETKQDRPFQSIRRQLEGSGDVRYST